MIKQEHELIVYEDEIKFIYPIYIATGEVLAIDRINKNSIITTFINEVEYKKAKSKVFEHIY
ncbi:hypothetical protein [Romboutsia ilealis]|uniref:hypothetical protein n=1 Tax=Romboutsia ilealis TaxID=1115758 RepID=UPI00272A2278|nr:hypothetical protein [Romboutsia ilealis]